ncbi:BTAD domain-containing putative transcriptional regulator [Jatrophihabitans lederbergiae]|uniref:BTAD domain-containing putative transcriptional regulator n=1 Tax=Jatrophihabitans lederbergiae TaxID=3075547 RepID=A0ABU2JF31_9ACTN|nr:BTAD domain-containing putative transcriptional regulator [Jatrophihabitans sp. DSM 44399]MDT0263605.1 BTAD domain-containing putative transcriptional regulator [Jatrophihabitans sp. DSM 44399]
MTLNRYPPTGTQPPFAVRAVLRLGRVLAGLLATGLLVALVAGVPYGLWHWIGWPLPHHVPTTTKVKDTLTGPFTDQILLDTLACLCWILWAVFLTDLAQALPDTLHNTHHPHTATAPPRIDHQPGPLRGLAALLLTAIVAGLLSLRPHPALASRSAAPLAAPRPGIVATAQRLERVAVPMAADTIPSGARTVVVQPPHDGIHDSLWRIAQRCLGDGNRWPEIYQLNKGHPQPNGGTLTMPSFIEPGWVLRLPTGSETTSPPSIHPAPTAPEPHPPSTPPALPAPPSAAPQPTHAPPLTTPASAHETPAVRTAGSHHGVDLGSEVYVSLGLASAVSAALVVARRRRRRFYIPGSGRRDDLPVAPVVRSLHLAHLRATDPGASNLSLDGGTSTGVEPGDDSEPEQDSPAGTPNGFAALRPMSAESGQARAPAQPAGSMRELPAGIAAGQLMATDLAALQSLGLVGPGAHDAARALILHLITTTDVSGGPIVLVPNQDAAILQLPGEQRLPARLRIVADLDAALDDAETAILRRARQAANPSSPPITSNSPESGGVVVVASAPADQRRLQAILDITTSDAPGTGGESGSVATVAAILLGQWRSGASLYVAADGTVTATNPGPAEPLRGARLFHLPAPHAADILDLLRAADAPRRDPDQQTIPVALSPDEKAASAARRGADAPTAAQPPARYTSRPTAPAEPSAQTSTQRQNLHGGPAPTDAAGKGAGARPSTVLDERRHQNGWHDAASLRLAVLGPLRLIWTPITDTAETGTARVSATPLDITGAFSPRLRELLVLLALHPDGITRDRLADTLWPDTPAGRPFATLNKNLARLRRTVTDATGGQVRDLIVTAGDRHQLDPDVAAVDFRAFSDALTSRRTAVDDEQRIAAYQRITAAYRGELADGLAAEWLETPREAARRDAVDAATSLARLLIPTDSRAALDQLEMARTFDPFNEAIYRDIMKVQRRFGQSDAIERTFALLTIRLAELEEAPEPETVELVRRLGQAAPGQNTG